MTMRNTLCIPITVVIAAGTVSTALAQDAPPELILTDVPRIGYNVRLCPFPGAVESAGNYVGLACDYDYLMGVSGAAFRRLWSRDDGGNVDLMYLAPEPHRRSFEAWSAPPGDFSLDLYAYCQARWQGLAVKRFPVYFGQRAHGRSHWNVDWRAKLGFIRRTLDYSIKLRRSS